MLEGSSPSVPAAGQVEKRGRLHLGQERCPWGLWAYSRSWDGSGVGSSLNFVVVTSVLERSGIWQCVHKMGLGPWGWMAAEKAHTVCHWGFVELNSLRWNSPHIEVKFQFCYNPEMSDPVWKREPGGDRVTLWLWDSRLGWRSSGKFLKGPPLWISSSVKEVKQRWR